MSKDEFETVREEYSSLKKILGAIFLLLVGCLIGGFVFFYNHNARLAVLEAESNMGPRWTFRDEEQFQSQYRSERSAIQSRVEVIEALMVTVSNDLAAVRAQLDIVIGKKND